MQTLASKTQIRANGGFVPPLKASGSTESHAVELSRKVASGYVPTERCSVTITVTPELAIMWLDRNTKNRNLREAIWKQYAVDMKAGRWQDNDESIKFDTAGRMIDGQHRLTACVASEIPFVTRVAFGLAEIAQESVDIGVSRSTGDIAGLRGIVNANSVTSIAKLVLAYDTYGPQGIKSSHYPVSKSQVVDFSTDPALQESFHVASRSSNGGRMASQQVLGFCHFVFNRQNSDLAKLFFEDFHVGANLSLDNAVYHLRNRLLGNRTAKAKLPLPEIVALFFKAWIAYRENRPVRVLRWANSGPNPEAFPTI